MTDPNDDKLYAYDLPPAECPGQFVSGKYVARPTGCPRLTLLDFGDVKVEWDAVPDAIHTTVRYFRDIGDDPQWWTTKTPYPGVTPDDVTLTGAEFYNLPREANVVYFSVRFLNSDFTSTPWSPFSIIWINDPLELAGAREAPDDVLTRTPDADTPGKPHLISANPSSGNGGKAYVDWAAATGSPTGYEALVEYSGGWRYIIALEGTGTSYAHATLREGTRRIFRVRGVNANGPGAWSEPQIFVADREDDSYPGCPRASPPTPGRATTWS